MHVYIIQVVFTNVIVVNSSTKHINVNLALFLFAGGGDVRDSG